MNNSSTINVFNNPLLARNILINADYNTIINYCNVYTLARQICDDELFWIDKAKHDFNTTRETFKSTSLTPPQRYLQLYNRKSSLLSLIDKLLINCDYMTLEWNTSSDDNNNIYNIDDLPVLDDNWNFVNQPQTYSRFQLEIIKNNADNTWDVSYNSADREETYELYENITIEQVYYHVNIVMNNYKIIYIQSASISPDLPQIKFNIIDY